MTGLLEITDHQMAQSKYTARKWFLFIMEVHSAVLASLHTSTSMQYYETNGTSHLQHNRMKTQLAGGNQLANYKREVGFKLDKIEKQYMQQ